MSEAKHYLVIDVESMGLYGEGFSVAGVVINEKGLELEDFHFSCPTIYLDASEEDTNWVNDNTPLFETTHRSPKGIRTAFWDKWMTIKDYYPNTTMWADCSFPVETNFLSSCVKDNPERKWEGPYPLHDIATLLLVKDIDPLQNFDRLNRELPKHNPLCDARQSARILIENIYD